ncbi:MAG: ABC transporter permease subunit [Chloroflexi bacterium]|nr:MAG: ABC transporter permease [Actinobacteria bacterium 13_2_20CM_2_66_6]TMD40794.1 MAG: ABC transporter permease subunit [Chloroflexota bacterium]TMD73922.1 MAG: ABC transporter permease subunit [Chloroflexota bacterium]
MGAVPFFLYVGVFLLLPTAIIVGGSLLTPGGTLSLANFDGIDKPYMFKAFASSIAISSVSAVVGAFVGALLAYAVVTGKPDGILRRSVMSAAGVLAQFGGVTLTFAFIATIGTVGFVYVFLQQHGIDIYPNGHVWLYDLPGLTLIYMYFQIPLMVLVFAPALDGIRPQWREATDSLGGGTWHYWRYIAGPLLFPSFLGCTLLLFANAFSAYATASALLTQGGVILPLQIQALLTSETGSSQPGYAKALALAMIVIVLVVMALYTLLQRRTAHWLR